MCGLATLMGPSPNRGPCALQGLCISTMMVHMLATTHTAEHAGHLHLTYPEVKVDLRSQLICNLCSFVLECRKTLLVLGR